LGVDEQQVIAAIILETAQYEPILRIVMCPPVVYTVIGDIQEILLGAANRYKDNQ
jgi:hypothetical protein